MSYDEKLADRVRHALPSANITERKMFGGLCFLLDGKMFVGVTGTDLMVRVGKEAYETALAKRHVRPMDFTGRPLTGFVFVGAAGIRSAAAVSAWVERSLRFVEGLPTKASRPRRHRRKIAVSRRANGGGLV